MIEIKFRGQTIKGEWVYGLLAEIKEPYHNVEAGWYISNSLGRPCAFQVNPKTIGQFTGVKDTEGKEIYKGDVLLCKNPDAKDPADDYNYVCEVVWDDENAGFVLRDNESKDDYSFADFDELGIIGNIYE